jgi:hypothetical protein
VFLRSQTHLRVQNERRQAMASSFLVVQFQQFLDGGVFDQPVQFLRMSLDPAHHFGGSSGGGERAHGGEGQRENK